jgi:hypothetical protein
MEHPDRLLHTGVRAVGRASAPSRIDIRLCAYSARDVPLISPSSLKRFYHDMTMDRPNRAYPLSPARYQSKLTLLRRHEQNNDYPPCQVRLGMSPLPRLPRRRSHASSKDCLTARPAE